jgi:hypothetical protein
MIDLTRFVGVRLASKRRRLCDLMTALRHLREVGDRLTGGGLRALGKRALSKGSMPQFVYVDCAPNVSQIRALFRGAWGHEPSAPHIATCFEKLRLGVSLEQLANELVSTDQFTAIYGTGDFIDHDFVRRVYKAVLGRRPNTSDLSQWTQ